MGLVELIATLVNAALAFFKSAKAKEQAAALQKERDAIENDPATWARDHFNGLQHPPDDAHLPEPSDPASKPPA